MGGREAVLPCNLVPNRLRAVKTPDILLARSVRSMKEERWVTIIAAHASPITNQTKRQSIAGAAAHLAGTCIALASKTLH